MNITTGKQKRPQRLVVYTPEGFGKSTLGSKFPAPLFLDMEKGGTDHLDVARVTADSYAEAKEVVAHVTGNSSEFGTLVVDTADWLEKRIIEHVCKTNKQDSIESFGYGKGYTYLAEEFQKFLHSLDGVITAGVNVLVLAHSHVKPFTPPDAAQGYDRYELKMTKQTAPILKEWADALLFGNFQTRVQDRQQGKARGVGGTQRVMHTEHSAAWDAKNRFGLPAKVEFGVEALNELIVPHKGPRIDSKGSEASESVTTPESAPDALDPILVAFEEAFKAKGLEIGEVVDFLKLRGQLSDSEGFVDVGKGYAQRATENIEKFAEIVKETLA
ncbi:MAG: hypothetical protein CMH53_11090 [Myxococcales bacterium]|nr:hypothetical protein [Myxococcales bacterium]